MDYSTRLKELRTSELLTQQEMANVLQISRSTYKDYELQIKILPIHYLNIICNYFHVSIDYLLGLSDVKQYSDSELSIDIEKQAERLNDLRKNKKITQEFLASILNTSHSMISDYENKKNFIPTPFLYQICFKYKISADYLLGKTNNPDLTYDCFVILSYSPMKKSSVIPAI